MYDNLVKDGIETSKFLIPDEHFHAEWPYVEMVEKAVKEAGDDRLHPHPLPFCAQALPSRYAFDDFAVRGCRVRKLRGRSFGRPGRRDRETESGHPLGVLVLSGETTMDFVRASDFEPSLICRDIEEFGCLLEEARR